VTKKKKQEPEKTDRAAPRLGELGGRKIVADETTHPIVAVPLGKNGTSGGALVVSASTYEGRKSLDLRRYYESEDGELRPTGKGVRIPAQHVAGLLEALEEYRRDILELLQ
jgi:hypothetical protein